MRLLSKSNGNAILETALIGLTIFVVSAGAVFYLGGGFEKLFNNKKSAINIAKDMYSIKKGKYENNLISSNFDMSLLNPDLNNAELKKMMINADSAMEAANIARTRANKANQIYNTATKNKLVQTENYNSALSRQQSAIDRANQLSQEALAAQQAAKKASEEAIQAAKDAQLAMQQAAKGGNVQEALAAQQEAEQARLQAIEAVKIANASLQEANEAKEEAQYVSFQATEAKQELEEAILEEQVATEDLQLAQAAAEIAEDISAEAQLLANEENPNQQTPSDTSTDPLLLDIDDLSNFIDDNLGSPLVQNPDQDPGIFDPVDLPIDDPVVDPPIIADLPPDVIETIESGSTDILPVSDPDPAPPVGDPNPAPPVGDPDPAPPVGDPNPAPPVGDPNPAPPVGDPNPAPPVSDPNPNPPVSDPNPTPPVSDPNPTPPVGNPNPTPPVGNPNPTPPVSDPNPNPSTGIIGIDDTIPACSGTLCVGNDDPIDPPPLGDGLPIYDPDPVPIIPQDDITPTIDLALASATLAQAAMINAQLQVYNQMIEQENNTVYSLADALVSQSAAVNEAKITSTNSVQIAMNSATNVNTSMTSSKNSYNSVKDLGDSIGVETAGTYGNTDIVPDESIGDPDNNIGPPPPPTPLSPPSASIDGGDGSAPPAPQQNPQPEPPLGEPVNPNNESSTDGGDGSAQTSLTDQALQYLNSVIYYSNEAQTSQDTAWSYAWSSTPKYNYQTEIETELYKAEEARDQAVNQASLVNNLLNQAEIELNQVETVKNATTARADQTQKALDDALAIKNALPAESVVYANKLQAEQEATNTYSSYQAALSAQEAAQNTVDLMQQELTSLTAVDGLLQGLMTAKTNAEKNLVDAQASNDPNAIAAAQQAYDNAVTEINLMNSTILTLQDQLTLSTQVLSQANADVQVTLQNYQNAIITANKASQDYTEYLNAVIGVDNIIDLMVEENNKAQAAKQTAIDAYNEKNTAYTEIESYAFQANQAANNAQQAVNSIYAALDYALVKGQPIDIAPPNVDWVPSDGITPVDVPMLPEDPIVPVDPINPKNPIDIIDTPIDSYTPEPPVVEPVIPINPGPPVLGDGPSEALL